MNWLKSWWYSHKYPPMFTLTISGVLVHFSPKCTSPIILRDCVIVPVRLFNQDFMLTSIAVREYVRSVIALRNGHKN